MSNRTLLILTAGMIFGLIVLVALNMTDLLLGQPSNQQYLKYNNVRGMAVSHNDAMYTLNFQQQNKVIALLNLSDPLEKIVSPKPLTLDIDKLVIYQFENNPDIVLTPVATSDSNLVFSVPAWIPKGQHLLMELSEGDLQNLLAQTYD